MQRAKCINRLIQGLVMIVLGTVLLWKQVSFLTLAMFIISLVVVFGGCAELVHWVVQNLHTPLRERKYRYLILALTSILLGLVMLLFPKLPQYLVPLLFSCYVLMNGGIKLIDTYFCIRNKSKYIAFSLIPAIFYLTFGGILLFSPRYHLSIVLLMIGGYCLLLGGTYLLDFVAMLQQPKSKQRIRRHFRFTPPIFLTALLPHKTLTRLNGYLSGEEGRSPDSFEDIGLKKTETPPDLEIFIHVSNNADMMIGHIDLCCDGKIIAYGNYDDASISPLGTGEGVLIRANRDRYLPFCLNFHKTTIFSFGLRLDREQRGAVRQRINDIHSQTQEWLPPYQTALRIHTTEEIRYKDFPDYASRMYEEAGARFYKFVSGRFKTFFVMTTNCALLVDSILGKAGMDLLNVNGINTPGGYYDYLETEFLKPGSMVVSREVYTLDQFVK